MILINDEFKEREHVSVDIEDRGFQFGDGVYEVIRYYNKKCFKLKEHLQRLERSLANVQMKPPFSIVKMEKKLITLMENSVEGNGNIYLQITRGTAERTHLFPPNNVEPALFAYTMPYERPIENIKNGIKAHLTKDIRWDRCDIKSLNLLANVLAKQEAKDNGCYESILHRDNMVTEGSSTNIFMVKDNELYTHPANNLILNGITRMEVIRIAKINNLIVKEKTFSVDQLLQADEVFLTSTTSEITPIIQVDDVVMGNGKPGAVTIKLIDLFEGLIGIN